VSIKTTRTNHNIEATTKTKADEADEADRDERESGWGGHRSRAAFYGVDDDRLPDAPRLRPGDHAGARAYLRRIEKVRMVGGWSRTERERLRRLERVWRARAEGKSAWFERFGNVRLIRTEDGSRMDEEVRVRRASGAVRAIVDRGYGRGGEITDKRKYGKRRVDGWD
jgi:hypothetical protein